MHIYIYIYLFSIIAPKMLILYSFSLHNFMDFYDQSETLTL